MGHQPLKQDKKKTWQKELWDKRFGFVFIKQEQSPIWESYSKNQITHRAL